MATRDMNFYLKEWRVHFGWTQPELAAKMGTVKSEVSRLEKGSRRMTTEWMNRAAAAFHMPAEELMTLPGVSMTRVPPPVAPDTDWSAERIGDIELRVRSENHLVFPVLGDEWSGVFEPGDLLIADRRRKSALTGGLFAVAVGGEVVIRRAVVGDDGAVGFSIKTSTPTKLADGFDIAGRVVARVVRV